MQKEIPILRALIQNLYQELDRKFHLNGAKIPITFGFDTDSLGSYTRRHLQQVPDPANTGNASDHFWTLEKRIRQDKKNLGVLIELRKSTAIWDIAYLVGDGVIKMDAWIPVRIEMDEDWYLVGLPKTSLSGLTVRM